MLFKILHGDDSNISTDITPFHEGWAYMTHSGNFYCDLNIGTIETPNNQRIKLNAKDAETITGVSLEELKNEFTNQDAVVLREAQVYVDEAIAAYAASHDLQVYVQSTAPTDANIGAIWLDTSGNNLLSL